MEEFFDSLTIEEQGIVATGLDMGLLLALSSHPKKELQGVVDVLNIIIVNTPEIDATEQEQHDLADKTEKDIMEYIQNKRGEN